MQVHGHRGCRGLMPENTLEAFQQAVALGVDTLEMDVCISKDGQVVVSHEPWFNHEFCTQPHGAPIDSRHERSLNLYRMPYEEIRRYDTGTKVHPRFSSQQKLKTYKPLLKDVLAWAEQETAQSIRYNIEIKYTPEGDTVFHPDRATFSELLLQVLEQYRVLSRTIVQCFDRGVLEVLHQQRPEQALSLLVEEPGTASVHLKKLSFLPAVYSPDYRMLSAEDIAYCHQQQVQVIPWTVNTEKAMQDMIDLKVDGIITDYPDRLIALLKKEGDRKKTV